MHRTVKVNGRALWMECAYKNGFQLKIGMLAVAATALDHRCLTKLFLSWMSVEICSDIMHLFRHYSTALSAVSSWCKSLRASDSATFKSSVPRCREEAEIAQRCRYVSNRVAIRRTAIIEATVGAPGLSIPMGLADNSMPVGIQIQSRPGAQNFTTVQISL